jgi:hypothetical protein
LSVLVTVFGTASREEFEKQFPQFVAAAHPTEHDCRHVKWGTRRRLVCR